MKISDTIRRTLRGSKPKSPIIGHVDQISSETASGWAADRTDTKQRLLILLIRNNKLQESVRADRFRLDLEQAGIGEGHHAFAFQFTDYGSVRRGPAELYAMRVEHARDLGIIDDSGALRSAVDVGDFSEIEKKAKGKIVRLEGAVDATRSVKRLQPYQPTTDKPINLLEIFDLLTFFNHHNRVTGIQRVVCSIIKSSLTDTSRYDQFEFCESTDDEYVLVLPQAELLSVIDRLLEGLLTQDSLIKEIAKLREAARSFTPRKGDRYVITGAYWIVTNYGPTLLRLRSRGVITACYIYDLIPITASQYVTDATRDGVVERGIEVLSVCDFFMTISQFVEGEVKDLLVHELGRRSLTRTVPLPHEVPYRATAASKAFNPYPRPFVLCVGTLEGRKNHKLLFQVWAGLIRKYGIDAVPDLVLVGKWGWKIDEFRELCASNAFLSNKIFIMQGISDAELSLLYSDCMFTVFPSFVEGWGLPVGESLASGKFCIASDASSVPEVGGDFVDYISPHDYFQAFRVIEKVIGDPEYLRERETNIREKFKPRTWADTTDLFHAAISDLASQVSGDAPRIPTLRSGDFYPVLHSTGALVTWRSREIKFVLAAGWHPLETSGVWGSAARSRLRFFADCPEGEGILVLLRLILPPERDQAAVEIQDAVGGRGWAVLNGADASLVEFETIVGPDGEVELSLQLLRFEPYVEVRRTIFVGLTGIAYCDKDDEAQGAAMLRNVLLAPRPPVPKLGHAASMSR